MSTAKRSRRRPAEGRSASPQPDAKRLKVAKSPHTSGANGLSFLLDEDRRPGKKLEARLTNGLPTSKSTHVDDSRAVVASDTGPDEAGPQTKTSREVINLSSDDDDDSSSVDDDEEADDHGVDALNGHDAETVQKLTNGHALGSGEEDDEEEEDGDAEEARTSVATRTEGSSTLQARDEDAMAEDGPLDEPTFGDMLRARHPEPIDIGGNSLTRALVPAPDNRGLAPPSSTSLGTVLTQALKTNDADLLESCFRLTDLPSIRSTIQRLQSQHAATLLQRLAERIHKRPGRTGSLMVWIQWSLVAHGAYLSNQPDVMRKIKSLTRVIRERANGLQPLLHLKGKLDLLSAQLELRRSLNNSTGQTDDEDDEQAVLYIEGEDEDEGVESDDEELETVGEPLRKSLPRKGANVPNANGLPNGRSYGTDEDSSGDEDMYPEDEDDLLDMEADEVSDDEDEEKGSDEEADSGQESDEEDELSDNDSEDDGSEVVIQQPKLNTLHRKR